MVSVSRSRSRRSSRVTTTQRRPGGASGQLSASTRTARRLRAGMMPCARGLVEQRLDGALPFRAEIDRVFVDVQIDVPVHHVFAHLLGMLAHERQAGRAMGERIFHAAAQHAIHGALHLVGERTADDDAAERDRRAGLAFPEFAQIDDLLQALGLVGEPVLVNDEPGVVLVLEQRAFDRRKHQLGLVARFGKRQAEKEIGGRICPGNGDPAACRRRLPLARSRRLEMSSGPQFLPSALPASSST